MSVSGSLNIYKGGREKGRGRERQQRCERGGRDGEDEMTARPRFVPAVSCKVVNGHVYTKALFEGGEVAEHGVPVESICTSP